MFSCSYYITLIIKQELRSIPSNCTQSLSRGIDHNNNNKISTEPPIATANKTTMKLAQKSCVLAALFALSGAEAFSSSTQSSRVSTTQLRSTIPKPGSVTSKLTPPSKLQDAPVADLFASVVYKTYGRYPLTFVSGDGSTLTDENGRTYLDFVSGIATCALGHNNPSLTEAVCDQMKQLHHVSNLYYTPGQGKLAQWLCENSCADKAFFCNSGAESNEAAIKLARKHAHGRGITVSIFECVVC